jgi:hypothetical protein
VPNPPTLLRFATLVLSAALVLPLAGCGGETRTPTPASPDSSGTAPATAPASSTIPAATSTIPASTSTPGAEPTAAAATPLPTLDANLPAGIEFAARTQLPGTFGDVLGALASEPVYFGVKGGYPVAARLQNGTWKVTRIDDDAGYSLPAGTHRLAGYNGAKSTLQARVAAVATGGGGMVAVGDGYVQGSAFNAAFVGFIWFTTDGVSWQRFDPRDILGGRNMSVFMEDVTATADGFIAVGSVASLKSRGTSEVVVLRSADGKTWSVASRISAKTSLGVTAIRTAGARLVLEGYLAPCDPHSGPNDGSAIAQATRVWQSLDGGATWLDVDLAAATPVLQAGEPAPADAASCPDPARDYQAFHERFSTRGSIIGVTDGRLVALSEDGGTVAVSSEDLSTWTTAPVPGAVAAPAPDGTAATAAITTLLTSDASGWILRSLQRRRDAAEVQLNYGCDVRWWRSTDRGATWVPGLAGRPINACTGGFFSFRPRSDGSITYFMIDAPVTPAPGGSFMTSTGGPVSQWDRCTPGPKADCAFVTMDGVGSAAGGPAVDWSGIDLGGATLTGVTLAGASLPGANLAGAVISGDLSGANLKGASLGYATITASLAGANLTGAYAFRTVFGGDLTGAKLTADALTLVVFLPGATCPDGKPPITAEGAAACRLR